MTTTDHLANIIAKLESAEAPSRELDAEIAAAIRVVPEFDAGTYRQDVVFRFEAHDDGKVSVFGEVPGYAEARLHCRAVPAYTTSIDAALTLCEVNSEWEVSTLYGVARVSMNLNHADNDGPHYGSREDGNVAIALCIASLKARAALTPEAP